MVCFASADANGLRTEEEVPGGNFPGRLALYIAVPILCFFLCIFMLTYCLVSKKSRRNNSANATANSDRVQRTRAILPTIQQPHNNKSGGVRGEHGSATSSSSVIVYKANVNGANILNGGNKSNPDCNDMMQNHRGAHQFHQGPPSIALVNHVDYSSSTGSHSLSGTSGGTPGSMLLANTMMQVLPPDGSGYPLLKANGHIVNGYVPQHDSACWDRSMLHRE